MPRVKWVSQEIDFMKQFFNNNYFPKVKENTFTLLIILLVKSLQKELHSTDLLYSPILAE
jgi:hypothetical protein